MVAYYESWYTQHTCNRHHEKCKCLQRQSSIILSCKVYTYLFSLQVGLFDRYQLNIIINWDPPPFRIKLSLYPCSNLRIWGRNTCTEWWWLEMHGVLIMPSFHELCIRKSIRKGISFFLPLYRELCYLGDVNYRVPVQCMSSVHWWDFASRMTVSCRCILPSWESQNFHITWKDPRHRVPNTLLQGTGADLFEIIKMGRMGFLHMHHTWYLVSLFQPWGSAITFNP